MENKKVYIIIIIVLAAYLLVILFLNKKESNKDDNIIVFNDSTILKIDKNKLEYIEKIDNIDKYKFDIYDYNDYIGKYNINYIDGKYRVFNEKNNLIKFEKDMIAIHSNDITFNSNPIEELNYNDNIIIQKMLEKENLKKHEQYTIANKRKVNINKENQMYIYNVTYSEPINSDNSDYFSILFISNGEKYYFINKSVVKQEKFIELKSFYIDALVDLDNDGTDEIIIDTLSYSQMEGSKKSIYKLSKDKYQELKVNTKK